jgi:hypothetical protein
MLFTLTTILVGAPLFAQVKVHQQAAQPAKQDTSLIAEPAISDTVANVRIFLDKIEVLGTVAKPQALFILPGNDPTVEGLKIERSFFKEIFRPVEWKVFKKNSQPSREQLRW